MNSQQSITATYIKHVMSQTLSEIANMLVNADVITTMEDLSKLVRHAINNDAKVYFTGIGKPAFVAMKLAATCRSIQIDAEYLDASAAGHGDIGGIPHGTKRPSLLIALSKSGLSSELYELFAKIRALRSTSITLVCMPTANQLTEIYERVNSLSGGHNALDIKVSAFQLAMPEIDGHGIIPTISNAFFEIIMSTIIGAASEAYTDQVLHNLKAAHPSGTLYNKVCSVLDSRSEPSDDQELKPTNMPELVPPAPMSEERQ
jgi:D-arabinose 5-phosphate isomerase GutQ